MKRLTDRERGIIVGLIIGEGSFTGDRSAPHLAIAMDVRHEHLLRWLQQTIEGSKLYGPYQNRSGGFYRWMVRSRPLRELVALIGDDIRELCPHVGARLDKMIAEYPRYFA